MENEEKKPMSSAEERLAEIERRSGLAEKRVEDMRWVIGMCMAFLTVLFSFATAITNINLYLDKKDFEEKVEAQRKQNDEELKRRIDEMNAALTKSEARILSDMKDRNDQAYRDMNQERANVRADGNAEEGRVEKSLDQFREEIAEKRYGSPQIEVFKNPGPNEKVNQPLAGQTIQQSSSVWIQPTKDAILKTSTPRSDSSSFSRIRAKRRLVS